MAGEVNRLLTQAIIAGLIAISLLLGPIFTRLRDYVVRHEVVLDMLVKDLSVMGVISVFFVLFTLFVDASPSTVVSFEVAHIFLFLFSSIHIGIVTFTVQTSRSLSARWITIENGNAPDLHVRNAEIQVLTHAKKSSLATETYRRIFSSRSTFAKSKSKLSSNLSKLTKPYG